MRTMTLIWLALVLLVGTVQARAQQDQPVVAKKDRPLFYAIVAQERAILDTLKENDIQAFADFLADDLLAIDDEGFHGKKDFVKEVEDQKKRGYLFTDFQMDDIHFFRVGEDAVVLAYKETIRGVDAGKPFVLHINTHSLYQRRSGKWVFRLFQDTQAK
jgi:ketosteroid isomerase-like protein